MARPRKKELPAPQTESLPADSTPVPPVEATLQPAEIIHGASESPRADPVVLSGSNQIEERLPESSEPVGRTFASGHIANPTAVRRESHAEAATRRLPDKLTVTAGDMKVQLIDAGRNELGVGIRVVFPQGRGPTDQEKELIRSHIRGEDGEPSGYKWDANAGLWHRPILKHGEHPEDVPPMRAVHVRLDGESRVQKLAEALREHSTDPVGYADMVQNRREQPANADRIPD
jgi:hypothetical protein